MATEDIQKLVVLLEARTAAFEKQMQKATASANRSAKQIETRFQSMQRGMSSNFATIGKGLGALGVAFGASQIIGGIQKILSAMDELVDTAAKIGITANELETLQRLAITTGSSAEAMSGALQKFSINLVTAATKGGDFAKVLEANGIAMRDQAGNIREPMDVLREYAEVMRRASSVAERGKFAAVAFGKANSELGVTFANGVQAVDDMSAALDAAGRSTNEQKERVAEAHDALEQLWLTVSDRAVVAVATGIEALDSYNSKIEDLGGTINDFVEAPGVRTFLRMMLGEEIADSVLGAELDATTARLAEIAAAEAEATEQIKLLQAEIQETADILDGATSSMIGDWVDVANQGIAYAQRKLEFFKASLASIPQLRADALNASILTTAGGGLTGGTGTGAIERVVAPPVVTTGGLKPGESPAVLPVKIVDDDTAEGGSSAAKTAKTAAGLATALRRAIGAYETRGLADPYHARGAAGEYGRYQVMEANIAPWSKQALGYSVSPSAFLASPEIQDRVAQAKVEEYLKNYGLEGAIRAWNTGQPHGTTTAGYVPGVMGMLEAGAGFEDAAGGLEELNTLSTELDDTLAGIRQTSVDFMQTFVDGILDGKTAVESLADAFDVLMDALEQLGRSLITSGINQIASMIFPAPPVGGALFGTPGAPGGGGLAGLIGNIFGRASGGPINPGQMYKVHKDELIVPRGPGSVIPAGMARKFTQGDAWQVSFAPLITINGNADRNTIAALREMLFREMESSLPIALKKSYRNRAIG